MEQSAAELFLPDYHIVDWLRSDSRVKDVKGALTTTKLAVENEAKKLAPSSMVIAIQRMFINVCCNRLANSIYSRK